ncbi:MAG TPA: Rv3654c family TadE-like protein [Micromonosporaceae bacterium]
MSRRADDRGSASLWLLAIGLVLVVVAMTAAAVGAIRVARHQAQVAADFGALAGAARVLDGPAAACARAGAFVTANGGRLRGCQVDGLDVQISVEVTAPAPGLPSLSSVAVASARAGPVRGEPGPEG